MKNKKITGLIIGISIALLAAISIVFIIPKAIEKHEIKAIEEAKQLEESIRIDNLNRDMINMMNQEFDGIFASMQNADDWSMDLFSGYIGKNLYKVNTTINSSEELLNAWYSAELTGNDLSYCVFIIDPYKLYEGKIQGDGSIEWTLAMGIEDVIANFPNTEFRIFMPFYDIDYWESHTEESFAAALSAYEKVMSVLSSYENVVLSCFSAYDWLTKNPNMFNDNGGLNAQTSQAFFLYNYREYWQVSPQKVEELIELMQDNLWFADPQEASKHWYDAYIRKEEEPQAVSYEYQGYEDYDVIFFGDSIFALNDGPYSIPICFENLTGARVYNLSRGGMTASKYYEQVPSMPELSQYIIDGKATGLEGYSVFDRDVEKFTRDDHGQRKLLIITDFGTNDYLFGTPIEGLGPQNYEGALVSAITMLKEAYPQAEIASFSIYYMLDCANGTVENDYGFVISDYKKALKKVSEDMNVKYLDMEALSPISEANAGYYLDDGIHPSMAGSYEISRILCENIR